MWLAVLLFVAMSAWWLTQDDRMPDWDSGLHEMFAATAHAELQTPGQLLRPFTDFNVAYPPLVHLLGALSIFVTGGIHPMAMILSSNVVFVPLLAFGCFGVGRIAYGPRAGLLAAILALGSPMFLSMMHEYDLDPPQAALVAVSVWAVLASRRFERVDLALLAGVLSGLAMMTKETSVVFLAGFLAVAMLRAGPRHWRGVLAYLVALGLIAGPWYVYHWHDLTASFGSLGNAAPNAFQGPARFSRRNLSWYAWDLVNLQVLAPFTLAFLVGVGLAVRRIVRKGLSVENVEPELLAGVIVSYLGMTYLAHKDPRYTLPMLVYVAVLATGWIGTLSRPKLRTALSAAVIVVAAIYFIGVSAGIGRDVRVRLPGAQNNGLATWQLTLYENDGYVRGGPVHDADVQRLLASLPSMGIKGVVADTGPDPIDFNTSGLQILALGQGLIYGPRAPLNQEAYLILRPPGAGGPAPCQTMNDGSGIYVVREPAPGLDPGSLRNPSNPRQHYTLVCPGRPPLVYP